MKTTKGSRVLGVAFLVQFVTSIFSGVALSQALIVPEDIQATMVNIAGNPVLMRANILVDMLTALGIVFLGAMLFLTLRKYGEGAALVALGFYVVEAALLAVSRMETFSLLRISQEYVAAGKPAYLETMARVALESADFAGMTLHMLAFCLGAVLFYYLLDRSRVVPRWLSLWGMISLAPLVVGTILILVFDLEISMLFYLPYVPFEFVAGVWIAVRGTREGAPHRGHR